MVISAFANRRTGSNPAMCSHENPRIFSTSTAIVKVARKIGALMQSVTHKNSRNGVLLCSFIWKYAQEIRDVVCQYGDCSILYKFWCCLRIFFRISNC